MALARSSVSYTDSATVQDDATEVAHVPMWVHQAAINDGQASLDLSQPKVDKLCASSDSMETDTKAARVDFADMHPPDWAALIDRFT